MPGVFFRALLLGLIVTESLRFGLNAQDSYRSTERQKMMDILAHGNPKFEVELVGYASADPRNQALVDFFIIEVLPVQRRASDLGFEANLLSIALDRALYNDEAEKKEWLERKLKASNELSAISNGDAYKNLIARWAQLAEGQTGFLADEARRAWRAIEIGAFDEKHLDRIKENTELQTKIDFAANESPFASNLAKVAENINQAKLDFLAGKVGLEEAARFTEAERAKGEQGQSQDIATKVGSEMNRVAENYSFLAKTKGFRSWAAYQVAVQAEPYEDRFNTVEGRIEFLEDALRETDSLLEELLNQFLSTAPGMRRQDLRESHIALLTPDSDSFGRYFPIEKVDQLWAESVLDQGFTQKDLDHISRDVFPRPNKYTHAYMNNTNARVPKTISIDAQNLSVTMPASGDAAQWYPSNIFIVQNFFSDTMDSIRVAFHEGGHALHFTYEDNPFGFPEAYGYIEIHSIMQEHILLDPEYIRQTAQTRDGQRPTDAEIQDYIRNAKINEFLTFRIILARALFELKLWDHDYQQSTETWTERATKLWGEIISRGTGVRGTENHGVDQTGRGPFNGPHFRAGWVQYIGYSQAAVAAAMTAMELKQRLLQETGRMDFWKQPGMARHLVDGYYREGYKRKFPLSVEAFTGQPYSVKAFVDFLSADIKSLTSSQSCEGGLAQARGLPRDRASSDRQPEAQP